MIEQPELFEQRPKPGRPKDVDARVLCDVLNGRTWVHGVRLIALLNDTNTGLWDKHGRRLRAAASASKGAVLSGPGSPGYCLTIEAHGPDVIRYAEAHGKQAAKETKRRIEILNYYHSYGGEHAKL